MRDRFLYIGVPMIIVLLLVSIPIYFIASQENRPRPIPKYGAGEIVKMRLSGDRGMVVSTGCWKGARACNYSIRFSSLQMNTNVSLFGSDGAIDIAPVALVNGIKEFELINERERE